MNTQDQQTPGQTAFETFWQKIAPNIPKPSWESMGQPDKEDWHRVASTVLAKHMPQVTAEDMEAAWLNCPVGIGRLKQWELMKPHLNARLRSRLVPEAAAVEWEEASGKIANEARWDRDDCEVKLSSGGWGKCAQRSPSHRFVEGGFYRRKKQAESPTQGFIEMRPTSSSVLEDQKLGRALRDHQPPQAVTDGASEARIIDGIAFHCWADGFKCPECGGSHFGSTLDGIGPHSRITERQCHDQFNKGCKWHGEYYMASDLFSMVKREKALREQVEGLKKELSLWKENILALLNTPEGVRCHEGGGEENLIASICITMAKYRSQLTTTQKERDETLAEVEKLNVVADQLGFDSIKKQEEIERLTMERDHAEARYQKALSTAPVKGLTVEAVCAVVKEQGWAFLIKDGNGEELTKALNSRLSTQPASPWRDTKTDPPTEKDGEVLWAWTDCGMKLLKPWNCEFKDKLTKPALWMKPPDLPLPVVVEDAETEAWEAHKIQHWGGVPTAHSKKDFQAGFKAAIASQKGAAS